MTSRDDARIHAARIAGDAATIAQQIDAAWSTLLAGQPGIRSVAPSSGSRGTGAPDDGAFNAAMARDRDLMVKTMRRLAKDLMTMDRQMAGLRRTVAMLASLPTEAPPVEWCEHLAAHGVKEEARYTLHTNGRVLRVSQWVYRWHRDVGALPGEKDIADRTAGRRPRRKGDVRREVA